MQTNKENLIVELTFKFALAIIVFSETLEKIKKYNLANQLFKSGTSIGANVREAQNAESKNDFIHKMKIAAKEADETEYWLLLCNEAVNYPDCPELINDIQSIQRVLSKIISSSKS
ncbi:four helix bundle protein [Taibaiella lutea]|uniref:Four helix bundle protein n=1 Tax=Taibaiella lutea TaxID=2608001 RepID=A0A5M6CTG9_9BACT|nr:four helix bundle protein [Taibaiella lutea]KAA5536305.1 four helix bundle protein [Taibaiella lutea]